MEHCTEGISIKIDDDFHSVKNFDAALELFQKEVLDFVNLSKKSRVFVDSNM